MNLAWLVPVLWLGAVLIYTRVHPVPLMDASGIPVHSGGFSSRDIPLDGNQRSMFKDTKVIKRLYSFGEDKVLLVMVDAGADRHAVHDPEICFTGSGWQREKRVEVKSPSGPASLIELRNGSRRANCLYWFQQGSARHATHASFNLGEIVRKLTFRLEQKHSCLVMLQSPAGDPVDFPQLMETYPEFFGSF